MATAQQKSSIYRFKDIITVPDAKALVDIILSQTQRRTPTQVHPQFKISRIRSFYMRKVKYCQQAFHDKFSTILTDFPRLDDIHPFYSDLCNVLYDRDHYKLALGQINTVRGVIDHIAKDYVRLLKYADSPYKCKMLKRAAFGRMCTAVRKLQESLKYLEQVRQHLSRLPSINPSTRTLILTGYPNVGKSSFINSLTHADVEVQPYAFTTKSLFVGHFDYGYSRWQLIDTPGILDHPLANRNTIELTAITALAHIQAVVLFLVDISEQCGFSIESQVSLFHSIKALFKAKPLLIVLNKVDVVKFEELSQEKKRLIEDMSVGLTDVVMVETSCLTATGIEKAKNKACEMLMTRRVESKISSNRVDAIENRLYVTSATVSESRPPNIPASVLEQRASTIDKLRQLKDIEEHGGGPGVFSVDLNKEWMLKNSSWTYDTMPEFFAGKNVLDFVDPDIEAKLMELEREEAALLQDIGIDVDDSEWQDTATTLNKLHSKIQLKRVENRLRKNHAHTVMPRTSQHGTTVSAQHKLEAIGYEINEGLKPPVARQRKRVTSDGDMSDGSSSMISSVEEEEDMGDGGSTKLRRTSAAAARKKVKTLSQARAKGIGSGAFAMAVQKAKAQRSSRITKSFVNRPEMIGMAVNIKRKKDRAISLAGRAGEADRFIGTKMPKHLFSGKRGAGKTDRR